MQKLLFLGGVSSEGSITHSKWIIQVWEPDTNDSLFYMGGLVKNDTIFGLYNPQVEKIENWNLL